MNKSFKVVFSKARGALMVVNELTSSVQVKGTKTVIAAAVASLVAGGAMAADTAKPGALLSWNGTELVGQAAGEGLVYSTKDGVLTITATGQKTGAEGVPGYGVLTNIYNADATGGSDILAKTAVKISGSTFKDNQSTNAGGAVTLWQDGSKDSTALAHSISGSTFSGNSANLGGAVALMNQMAFDKKDGTTLSERNTYQENTALKGGAVYVEGSVFASKNDDFTNNKAISTKSENSFGGAIYVGNNGSLTVENGSFNTNESGHMGGALFVTGEGSVKMTDVTFDGNTSGYGGAAMFNGHHDNEANLGSVNKASITATNVKYLNNNASKAGGGLWLYTKTKYEQTGGSFVGNKANQMAGAVFVKGAEAVFTDVLFENNVVRNENAVVAGGAVYVDPVKNSNVPGGTVPASAKFVITKDMTYSGNNAIGKEETNENTYGYLLGTSGGFLLLDRGSSATFDIHENATLTIGKEEDAAANMDSIASAYPDKNDPTMVSASITKTGLGTLLINSDMNKYFGTLDVNAGRFDVRKAWTIKDHIDVNGGTLALTKFDFGSQPHPVTNRVGSVTVKANGTLETSSDQIFTKALDSAGTATDAGKLLYAENKIKFETDSTLALTDKLYNLEYAQSAGGLLTNGKVTMLGDLINKDTVNESTLGDLEQVGENIDLPNLTVKAEDKNIQIGGTLEGQEGKTTTLREESLSVGSIDLGTATTVTVAGGETLTLAGNGKTIVSSEADDGAKVVVEEGTLALGGTVSNGGTVESVEVLQKGNVTVVGDATYTIDELVGSGNVYVGTDAQAGDVVINDISEMTGMIFADPETASSASETSGGSVAGFSDATKAVKAYLVSGRNALWATDATKAEGVDAFNKIGLAQGLAWGEDVTAALYVGKTLQLGTTGSVLVDGSMTSENVTARVNGTATVNNKGMLIVNQNVGEAIVGGNVVLTEGSYLGVVNSAVGEFKLASGTVTDNGTEVVTDNPFIQGSLNAADKTVVNKLDAESGLGAIASTGVQAMARRADFVMTETVANRTSLDQPMHAGVNLWADVSGERYEADKLDNNGSFRADAAYATFGADVEVLEGLTAGLALQYGDASLRSDVSGIKNDITSYGLTAYAGKSFGAAKIVGELAWLKSENDITAHQTALNQKLDANIWSAGVRAQYELAAGSFKFVPSIGLRVSRLETDDMTVGSIKVDEGDLTYVQMPISLRISGFEADAAGWTLAPSFKVAYVPTFGDKEVKVLGYSQDVLDMSPVQADFGLRAVNGNLMFNVDMMLGGGEAGTSSIGGKVGVKYAF